MFCDQCKLKAFSGNSNVCGYFLHGGETVYINETVAEWCPKAKNNKKLKLDAQGNGKCTCDPMCMCSFCASQKFYQGTA